MGITGNLWSWFRAYQNSRSQLVSVNGHHSNTLPVTSGVPQGSILDHLLFPLFINDLPTLVKSAKLLLFADDTKCVKYIANHTDCTCLQNDLDSLYNWSFTNIAFNKEKAVLVRFNANCCPVLTNYFLDNQQIVPRECHRDLGVVVSNNLSGSARYIKIVSKAY